MWQEIIALSEKDFKYELSEIWQQKSSFEYNKSHIYISFACLYVYVYVVQSKRFPETLMLISMNRTLRTYQKRGSCSFEDDKGLSSVTLNPSVESLRQQA
jgi:hypothetical protein